MTARMDKKRSIDSIQQKVDRRVDKDYYIIKYVAKWPDLEPADTKMPPSDIDDILEGLDRWSSRTIESFVKASLIKSQEIDDRQWDNDDEKITYVNRYLVYITPIYYIMV